ncbi:MAG: twin-arginine translocation signal domain-containing protein [Chitinophagaceae bacterium]|nr:twin-arginine translocation signal domain-containing protein [Chitinophagaceae bacterium]
MEDNQFNSSRRNFLGAIASGAAIVGAATITTPFQAVAAPAVNTNGDDAEQWFNKIKGKHRVVFDATQPHDMMPFAWPRVFLISNAATGSPEKDCGVVVVLRHAAIPYAMQDALWQKYNFGEVFKADDPISKTPATKNPFWQPKPGQYKIPGFGEVQIGINELQSSGVMFCVCDAAMTVYSAVVAEKMGMAADAVKKEWTEGILPGVQPVPSGVWALGRAQEHNCTYVFAG